MMSFFLDPGWYGQVGGRDSLFLGVRKIGFKKAWSRSRVGVPIGAILVRQVVNFKTMTGIPACARQETVMIIDV